ncbi:metal-binding protein ZinT [Carnobacterium gallinarum]|uniref:metal-binding protein ZinT n=1 Tax=Carnobacterium gallinarum TaxID=2749 RepID=UPI000556706D|nr:metal-binding protein ZinT [Carnobacterium gallinarum]
MKLFLISVLLVGLSLGTGCQQTGKSIASESQTKENSASLVSEHVEKEHFHSHEKTSASQGIFEDSAVQDRLLSDWEGSWQSVYPYLVDGSLDEVFKEKAKDGEKSFEEYKEYYEKGYQTEIEAIDIVKNTISYRIDGKWQEAQYDYSGYKILTYESGKKGVRYLFTATTTNMLAPKYVQFSDHIIEPQKSSHFHIYLGNENQDVLLSEMKNWPTFFPSTLNKKEIIHDMLYH